MSAPLNQPVENNSGYRHQIPAKMVSRAPGCISVFGVGVGGLYDIWRNDDSHNWARQDHGGTYIYQPITISRERDEMSLFLVGADLALYHKSWRNYEWSGTTRLGWQCMSTPAASRRGNGTIDVFHIGRDGALYHKSWDGKTWLPNDGYHRLTGTFIHTPTAVSWGKDHIALFAVGIDSHLYHSTWTSRFGWGPFEKLDVQLRDGPKAVSDKPGNIDVFGISVEGNLTHIPCAYGSWGPAHSMGTMRHSPEVISWGPDRIDLFAIRSDGNISHKSWEGEMWGDWESMGGCAIHSIKAVSHSVGNISVFHRGRDGGFYHCRIEGEERWSDWEALGAVSFTSPG